MNCEKMTSKNKRTANLINATEALRSRTEHRNGESIGFNQLTEKILNLTRYADVLLLIDALQNGEGVMDSIEKKILNIIN